MSYLLYMKSHYSESVIEVLPLESRNLFEVVLKCKVPCHEVLLAALQSREAEALLSSCYYDRS